MDQQQPRGYESRRPEFLRPAPPLWLVLGIVLVLATIGASIVALAIMGGAA